MAPRPKITVLGSLNMDISVTVARLPAPGATVLGSAARFAPGGKGANQAVAAARLGADVRLAGCIGDDDFGRQLLATLRVEAIDARAVRTVSGVPTGVALITVDRRGENLITVAPGANHEVGRPEVTAAASGPGDVLVISAEIPAAAITQVLARASAPVCVLNLAPGPPTPQDARALLAGAGRLDWLVVNQTEAGAALGRPVDSLAGARRAATELAALGARHAVVTAGAHGAALAGPDGDTAIPGYPVTPVDTVGAGDTFVGALAVALAAGLPAAEAARAAAAAGAAAVTRPGAQAGMPRARDILAVTGVQWPVG